MRQVAAAIVIARVVTPSEETVSHTPAPPHREPSQPSAPQADARRPLGSPAGVLKPTHARG
jgi:hypothetical protein